LNIALPQGRVDTGSAGLLNAGVGVLSGESDDGPAIPFCNDELSSSLNFSLLACCSLLRTGVLPKASRKLHSDLITLPAINASLFPGSNKFLKLRSLEVWALPENRGLQAT